MTDLFLSRFSFFRSHLFTIGFICLSGIAVSAQSTLLDFPSPVTGNELSGSIKARDIGDSRLTTFYFWFDGGQGDVFVNFVTKNFAGDIDIFIQSGLRPLTKVVVYPDFGEVETGRVLYLRKPERLLMRVQGRTPNDDAASFRMKFAGSFIAASGSTDTPEMPKVTGETSGSIAVNSVGTIVTPPRPIEKRAEQKETAKTEVAESQKDDTAANKEATVEKDEIKKEVSKLEVVVSDDLPKNPAVSTEPKAKTPVRSTAARRRNTRRVAPPVKEKTETKVEGPTANTDVETAKKPPEKKVDPLADVQLVIVFKDGARIERPLPEVFRFSVDRGVLTVVSKDGRIGKYKMVDVAKVTIE